ncbi:uncharacterized protein LOC129328563 [Eublepharis macularius]|uniref:Uncharacterized protein LOC129328563 n=1 Tax=Eublepharis macularius TaxID=481883 RepID=A0AA97J8I1_EUBMA|nr:uncharacterized protein LOC129328563 [Eublepharis macularius]
MAISGALQPNHGTKLQKGKLKASLESLEDGMKWATSNQSHQQEAIEELESLSQHLYGHIFIEFESLRQILDAKEQSMMDTVKQMKADNQAEMERRLAYLKAYESSHAETTSRVRAALEETNEFALLKGIKELMRRIQDHLGEENGKAEHEVCAHDQRAKETEEKDTEDEKVDVNMPEGKGNENKNDEGETYGEAEDAEEAQDAEDIVPVDPALEELEEWLDFETWKEMLESISIWETPNPDSFSWFPSPEEDMFQLGDSRASEALEEEATSEAVEEEDLICAVDVTSAPDEVASDKPLPSSSSDAALPMGRALHSPPPSHCTPNYFPVPVFQQIPLYNVVQRWGAPCRWRPSPRRGWAMLRGRGATVRHFLSSRGGHGRGFQSTFKPREAGASGQGRGWLNTQKRQSSGSSNSGQSSGGKTHPPKPRGTHVSGRGGSGQGRGSASSPGRGGSGQGQGSAVGRGGLGQGRGSAVGQGGSGQGRGSAVGRGGSGQGRASAQKGPTHHSGGRASSSKGSWNRQASHQGGCGRGSGSAKGSRGK